MPDIDDDITPMMQQGCFLLLFIAGILLLALFGVLIVKIATL